MNPSQPNPNQGPAQNTNPQLPHHQPLPPMTKKQRIRLFVGLVVAAAIIVGIIYGIGAISAPAREYSTQQREHREDVLANGIEAPAVSTGEVRESRERSGKRFVTVYHAVYTYTIDGLDYPVSGEKDYGSNTDVKAGMKATLKYLPTDPLNPVFTSEE